MLDFDCVKEQRRSKSRLLFKNRIKEKRKSLCTYFENAAHNCLLWLRTYRSTVFVFAGLPVWINFKSQIYIFTT